jgi:TonB family protein
MEAGPRRGSWRISGLVSMGAHLALLLGLLGGGTRMDRLRRPAADLHLMAADAVAIELVSPDPPPPEPALTPTPVATWTPRQGHTARHIRPAPAALPVRQPVEGDPVEPPAFEPDEQPAQTGDVEPVAEVSRPSRTLALAPAGEELTVSPGEASYLRTSDNYPSLPRSLWVAGRIYSVLVQVCVSTEGRVSKVSVQRGAAPELDRAVVSTIMGWHYRPRLVAGAPRPFCHLMKLDFSLH